MGHPGHSVYASTKGAINSFTKQLSVELIPKHIRVNAIAPGYVATKMTLLGRKKPNWLPPQPFLNIGIYTRLAYERLKAKSET